MADAALIEADGRLSSIKEPKKADSGAVVGSSLAPLALPSKAESVVSITSQCSYSSTIVHVGDKKPQPDSGICFLGFTFSKRFCIMFPTRLCKRQEGIEV